MASNPGSTLIKEKRAEIPKSTEIQEIIDRLDFDDTFREKKIEELIKQKEKEDKESKIRIATERFCGNGFSLVPENWTIDNYKPKGWDNFGGWEGGYNAAIAMQTGNANGLFAAPSNYGKSHLACAVARVLIQTGKTAYRLKEPRLYQAWMKFIHSDSKLFNEILRNAVSCDILIYDELGKFRLTDKTQEQDDDGEFLSGFGAVIYDILDERAERNKRTIFTTQTNDLQKLGKRIGFSIYKRVVRMRGPEENCIKAVKLGMKR